MRNETSNKVGILGIASDLPKKIISVNEVASISGYTEDHLISKLGFKEKRIAEKDEHPSKFALAASRKVLKKSKFDAKDLDFIIYCSNGIFDYQFWSPSAYIQSKIKANKAITFEINNGCNAATSGMHIAFNLLSNNSFRYGLLVICDTISKFIDYKDKKLFPLFSFGDGASALLLGKDSDSNLILSQALHTDGNFVNCNKLFFGGTKSQDHQNNKFVQIHLCDKETDSLRNSMVKNYIKVIQHALKNVKMTLNDISYFLINQNSLSIVNDIISALKIPKDKLFNTRECYGHMGAIDTVFALEIGIDKKIMKKNDLILMASMGIGYHWGAQVIRL